MLVFHGSHAPNCSCLRKTCFAQTLLRYDENFAIILETSFLIQFYRLYSLYNNSR